MLSMRDGARPHSPASAGIHLIAMIDDATTARFVRHDSTADNRKLAWNSLEKFGRPVSFYTDQASLFRTAEKCRHDEPGVDKDLVEMPPTQIARALGELGIGWLAAHSPQAKGAGREELSDGARPARERVASGWGEDAGPSQSVPGGQLPGVVGESVVGESVVGESVVGESVVGESVVGESVVGRAWWGRELTVTPARPDNAHRPLKAGHNLAGAWSHVETRQVRNEDTLRFDKVLYRVKRESIVIGLRGAGPRFEWRSGWTARCIAVEVKPVPFVRNPAASRSNWNGKFDWKKAPPIGKAAQSSGHRTG
jgi:hypothetical protein